MDHLFHERAPRRAIAALLCLPAVLSMSATATATMAQGKFYAKLMQRYGGVLAPDCSNYLLPQLKYLGDSLVVQDKGRAVLTGRNPKAAPTHFGAKPPPGFETAIASEVAPGEALVFVFYRNAAGVFAAVEGGPRAMAVLPKAFANGQRARHCDPNRNRVPGTAPSAELGPPDMLRDARFKRAYVQALGALAREPWLMRLDGPGQPIGKQRVAGAEYQFVSVCKPHDCYDHSMVVLYAATSQTVHGLVQQRGRLTLIGAPPPAVSRELERLWRSDVQAQRVSLRGGNVQAASTMRVPDSGPPKHSLTRARISARRPRAHMGTT